MVGRITYGFVQIWDFLNCASGSSSHPKATGCLWVSELLMMLGTAPQLLEQDEFSSPVSERGKLGVEEGSKEETPLLPHLQIGLRKLLSWAIVRELTLLLPSTDLGRPWAGLTQEGMMSLCHPTAEGNFFKANVGLGIEK